MHPVVVEDAVLCNIQSFSRYLIPSHNIYSESVDISMGQAYIHGEWSLYWRFINITPIVRRNGVTAVHLMLDGFGETLDPYAERHHG